MDPLALNTANTNPNKHIQNKQTLSLVVWNIFKGHKPHSWKHLSGFHARADFIAIQEMVFHPHTEYDFYTHHPETYWSMGTSFVFPKTGLHTGTALASDYHVSDTYFHVSNEREPFTKTPKSSMAQTYPLADRDDELLIAHVHAINFTRFKKFKSQIDILIDKISQHNGPAIVSGDFNTHLYPRKKYLFARMTELGYTLSRPHNDRRLLPYTHVFVREVQVESHRYAPSISSSDHKPFILEFFVK